MSSEGGRVLLSDRARPQSGGKRAQPQTLGPFLRAGLREPNAVNHPPCNFIVRPVFLFPFDSWSRERSSSLLLAKQNPSNRHLPPPQPCSNLCPSSLSARHILKSPGLTHFFPQPPDLLLFVSSLSFPPLSPPFQAKRHKVLNENSLFFSTHVLLYPSL